MDARSGIVRALYGYMAWVVHGREVRNRIRYVEGEARGFYHLVVTTKNRVSDTVRRPEVDVHYRTDGERDGIEEVEEDLVARDVRIGTAMQTQSFLSASSTGQQQ